MDSNPLCFSPTINIHICIYYIYVCEFTGIYIFTYITIYIYLYMYYMCVCMIYTSLEWEYVSQFVRWGRHYSCRCSWVIFVSFAVSGSDLSDLDKLGWLWLGEPYGLILLCLLLFFGVVCLTSRDASHHADSVDHYLALWAFHKLWHRYLVHYARHRFMNIVWRLLSIAPAGCENYIAIVCLALTCEMSLAFIIAFVFFCRCWTIADEQGTAPAGREYNGAFVHSCRKSNRQWTQGK